MIFQTEIEDFLLIVTMEWLIPLLSKRRCDMFYAAFAPSGKTEIFVIARNNLKSITNIAELT